MKKTILSFLLAVGLVGSASAQFFTNKFNFTGYSQSFTVPVGVTSILFQLYGASGGDYSDGTLGGAGSCISGELAVNYGEIINIFVGGSGHFYGENNWDFNGGFNGGGNGYYSAIPGGGGSTDIRIGGTNSSQRIAVAAGGGAASGGYGIGNHSTPGWGADTGNYWVGGGGQGISFGTYLQNYPYGVPSSGGGGGYIGGGYISLNPSVGIGTGGESWVDTNKVISNSFSRLGTGEYNYGTSSTDEANGYATIAYTSLPEPSTYALFGIGALALVIAYRRKVA